MAAAEGPSTVRRTLGAPWHLPIFALFVPYNLFAHNAVIFFPGEIVRAAIVFAIVAAVVFLILCLVTRRAPLSALLTSFLFLSLWLPWKKSAFELAVIGGIFVLILLAYFRAGPRLAAFIMNAMAIGFLIAPTMALTSAISAPGEAEYRKLARAAISGAPDQAIEPSKAPNIFHIVLDGYGSREAIRRVTGFDNQAFLSALEDRGFIVFPKAQTPYNQTLPTLASVFAGEYFETGQWPLTIGNDDRLRYELGRLVAYGPVASFLRQSGYQRLVVGSEYAMLKAHPTDVAERPEIGFVAFTPFEKYLLEATALSLIYHRLLRNPEVANRAYSHHLLHMRHAMETRFFLDQKRPYLFFEHVLAPHPPFVVDRDGNFTRRWIEHLPNLFDGDRQHGGKPELQAKYKDAYVENLRYISAAVGRQIDTFMGETSEPKIIILQGDHGSGVYYHVDEPEKSCLGERFSTLLAIYASDPALRRRLRDLADQPFNLVNIYRLVLGETFDRDFTLLPNQSYFIRWSRPQETIPLDDAGGWARCAPQANR